MRFNKFSIGMRNVKTGIAVFLCILLFHVFHRGSPMIAALAATFAMRQDIGDTVTFGRNRVIGNSIGGVAAILYYGVYDYFQHSFYVELILLPIAVMIVIAFSVSIGIHSGIVGATATLLMIALSIPHGETFLYALQRVIDTFIGTVIAIIVNSFIKPPKTEEIREIESNLEELQTETQELKALEKEIKEED